MERDQPAILREFREMFAGIANGQPVNDSNSMARSSMLAILGRMATHSGQLVGLRAAIVVSGQPVPKRMSITIVIEPMSATKSSRYR